MLELELREPYFKSSKISHYAGKNGKYIPQLSDPVHGRYCY